MEAITFETLPKAVSNLTNEVGEIKRLLQQKVEMQPIADELLTVQQAAVLLKLSVPTIYGLVSKTEIPVNKRGKRLYFSKQEITEWIKKGRKQTKQDLDAKVDAYLQSKIKRG